jgi:ComF family protein
VSLLSAAGTARRLAEPVLSAVFPSACPVCGGLPARPRRGPLCEECRQSLSRQAGEACPCGMPRAAPSLCCGRCRRGLQPLAAGASLGAYEGGLKALVDALRREGRPRVAGWLAEALLADPVARGVLAPGDRLLPLPLHPRRRSERGFSPSELLASEIARSSGLPLLLDALVRRQDTPSRACLSAACWRRSLKGAFAVRRRAQVAGRVVVLVDDLLATGATARACARVLRAAGAAEVRFLAAARVRQGRLDDAA